MVLFPFPWNIVECAGICKVDVVGFGIVICVMVRAVEENMIDTYNAK